MAYFHIDFFSTALHRTVSFQMMIPNDTPVSMIGTDAMRDLKGLKTIFFLHGYTGHAFDWQVNELAVKYGFAAVMPSGENSFYLDGEATGQKFATLVGEEMVNYVRKTFGLAMTPEDTFVLGYSMGGFGALHTALAYPDTFGKAVAMSSALLVHEIAHMKPGGDNGIANYEFYRSCFGDLETVEESDANPETLVKKLMAAGKPLPGLYLCCGTEDFLIEKNRAFRDFLVQQGAPHEYHESTGVHDFVFWNEYIRKGIHWMYTGE